MIIEINKIKYDFDFPESFKISANNVKQLENVIRNCLESIKESNDLRKIVLETWLIVDFFVRLYLEQFFNLTSFTCNNLDPKYKLLPHSFANCVNFYRQFYANIENCQ